MKKGGDKLYELILMRRDCQSLLSLSGDYYCHHLRAAKRVLRFSEHIHTRTHEIPLQGMRHQHREEQFGNRSREKKRGHSTERIENFISTSWKTCKNWSNRSERARTTPALKLN